jgi:hypothetical protein
MVPIGFRIPVKKIGFKIGVNYVLVDCAVFCTLVVLIFILNNMATRHQINNLSWRVVILAYLP